MAQSIVFLDNLNSLYEMHSKENDFSENKTNKWVSRRKVMLASKGTDLVCTIVGENFTSICDQTRKNISNAWLK